ncbi:MAG: hydroxymethylglutaryl-CoA lyase [Saprospirales bacterium]|nr:MAG: hydroxymethylglutaryl-CoA lyase [Saprospirales bacterium]
MQGLRQFIPTEVKISYLNQLLKVGFHTIDFGSFVSPKAIPQLKDSPEVIRGIDPSLLAGNRLLAIVANRRGAVSACEFDEIKYLGYPFSISETFQVRNTNATIEESMERLKVIRDLAFESGKEMVVYLSMGFGNPYGDPWNAEILSHWTSNLHKEGIRILMLSDTIGVAKPESISYIFANVIPEYSDIEFGAHFHTGPHNWKEKVEAAFLAGCNRFDSAIKGFGGCPMAKDDLTGNMATENLLYFFDHQEVDLSLNRKEFNKALLLASDVFPQDARE